MCRPYSFNKMQERGRALADQVKKGVNLTDAMAETGLFLMLQFSFHERAEIQATTISC